MAINQFTTEQQDRYNELIGAGASELEARGAVSLIPAKSQLSSSETTLPEVDLPETNLPQPLPSELPQESDVPTQLATSDFDRNYRDLLSENAKIREQYLQSLQPSEQELSLEQQIAKIKESAGLGIQDIKEQTIPMGAIIGQAKNVEERANLQLQALADQLGIAQKGRLATQEGLKAGLGFVGEDIKLIKDIQDRIDSQNQQYIENAQKLSTDARNSLAMILENFVGVDPNTLDAASQAQISQIAANAGLTPSLVFAGMKAVKDQQDFENYQKLKKGDTPSTPSDYLVAQSQEKINNISDLIKNDYLDTAVGPNALSRTSWTNFLTGGKSNFIAGIEQLQSELSLSSLIDAKSRGATFGALSDTEMRILSAAASKIGTWAVKDDEGNVTGYKVGEKAFKEELDKINNFAKLDYIYKGGNPEDIGAKIMEDGTIWTLNSDGSYVLLIN